MSWAIIVGAQAQDDLDSLDAWVRSMQPDPSFDVEKKNGVGHWKKQEKCGLEALISSTCEW